VAGVGRGVTPQGRDDHDEDRGDYSESKYDEWSGIDFIIYVFR
jgi:hypothetical protein